MCFVSAPHPRGSARSWTIWTAAQRRNTDGANPRASASPSSLTNQVDAISVRGAEERGSQKSFGVSFG